MQQTSLRCDDEYLLRFIIGNARHGPVFVTWAQRYDPELILRKRLHFREDGVHVDRRIPGLNDIERCAVAECRCNDGAANNRVLVVNQLNLNRGPRYAARIVYPQRRAYSCTTWNTEIIGWAIEEIAFTNDRHLETLRLRVTSHFKNTVRERQRCCVSRKG